MLRCVVPRPSPELALPQWEAWLCQQSHAICWVTGAHWSLAAWQLGQASLLAWEAAGYHALVVCARGVCVCVCCVCDWKMEPPVCSPTWPGLLQELQL